jgi:hypothetical protein
MIYCLHGDSNSLDDKLKEILQRLGLDDGTIFEKQPQEESKGRQRSNPKKEGKKM